MLKISLGSTTYYDNIGAMKAQNLRISNKWLALFAITNMCENDGKKKKTTNHRNKIEPFKTNVGFFSFTDDWHWVSDAQVTEPSYQFNLDRWTHDEPQGAFSRNCVVLIRRQAGTMGLRTLECSGPKDFVCESTSCELLFMNNNKYYHNNHVVPLLLPLLHLTCIISIISTAVRLSFYHYN